MPTTVAQPHVPAARHTHSLLENERSLGLLLMLPGALLLVVFMAYPFFLGLWLSVTDSTIGHAGRFVAFRNFTDLLGDSIFRQTARNTFIYALVTVPFKLLLGLGLALVLNAPIPFRNAVRAGVLMPFIVPTALSSLGWLMIFDPIFSPISWLLRHWGLIARNINFLGGPVLAIVSVMIANIWRGTPFFGVTILAGLQAVPAELHDAAAIDGAGAWHRFRNVTLPIITGVMLISTLFSIIMTFADFQLIYILTKGGPANETHIFGTYAYQIGLSATEIGQGAAIALYMFPLLAVLAVLLLRYLRRDVA
ncbi:MAG TPA: sugar ABC transporter permease [bacterium]|nr:sugar ABC transporter permease [bacterium]